ncbi:MAG: transposase [Saprospirales bacterium]|nr:transposase [Saprospirales bacterium]
MVYTIVMLPNPKADAEEPTLIFLTTLPNAQKAAHLYAKRWKIECLFRHLKTNGYNLEDLNLKELNKSLLMMAIVTTAISWLFAKAGNDDDEFQPSATKTEAKHPKCPFSEKAWQS